MKHQPTGATQLGNWYALAAVAAAGLGLAVGAHDADAAQVVVHPVGGPVTAPYFEGEIFFNPRDTTGTQVVAMGVPVSSEPPQAISIS
jgi:hypothetical protein